MADLAENTNTVDDAQNAQHGKHAQHTQNASHLVVTFVYPHTPASFRSRRIGGGWIAGTYVLAKGYLDPLGVCNPSFAHSHNSGSVQVPTGTSVQHVKDMIGAQLCFPADAFDLASDGCDGCDNGTDGTRDECMLAIDTIVRSCTVRLVVADCHSSVLYTHPFAVDVCARSSEQTQRDAHAANTSCGSSTQGCNRGCNSGCNSGRQDTEVEVVDRKEKAEKKETAEKKDKAEQEETEHQEMEKEGQEQGERDKEEEQEEDKPKQPRPDQPTNTNACANTICRVANSEHELEHDLVELQTPRQPVDWTALVGRLNKLTAEIAHSSAIVEQAKGVCLRFDGRVDRARAYLHKMHTMRAAAQAAHAVRSRHLIHLQAAVEQWDHVRRQSVEVQTQRAELQRAQRQLDEAQSGFASTADALLLLHER